ncbi:ankyrin repeat protein SKIP35-like [Phalaenopsis equestris]|uniref:ankyrin repeat protein SKIP35-like n=1 Tax=Phalaenopsis equestris TaxID=78828 RepID=UPI0009E3CC91|nr:ankyrin repeat protein SKIP35-like [Phalaenopsis equestris]XP_020575530.1 ankyrin repeat protein SKIP35-like [Phalaenopsis equestris]
MVAEEESGYVTTESHSEDPLKSGMDIDENGVVASWNQNGDCSTQETGEGSSEGFYQQASQENKDHQVPKSYGACAKKFRFRVSEQTEDSMRRKDKEKSKLDRRLSRQDRIELGRMFQGAVSSHDWELAENLILLADPQTLNDALCIALDSIWFLKVRRELDGITGLIKKIVSYGARDFTRAALRTSFLASCVSACQSRTISLADTVAVMAQRLHDRLQECNGDEILKAEAGAKVQKFTEWALKCIGFHSRCQENRGKGNPNTAIEVHFQLSAFKTFLDLAGNNLSGKDFTEAFDAACFPLTLFSSSFDPGWASGISAYLIQGLLGMLVEGGADNVNQCFLEASRFGSTELVRILLQIAQRNSLDVDVDLAFGFASHYSKIGTMECLVEEGHAAAFLGPLMRAAERGCMPVVQWFINRGCRDMELCLALTAATSSSQVEVTAYLLPHVPQHVLAALSVEIIKAAGERSGGSLDGVAFLLQSNFLRDAAATYAVADSIARSDDEAVARELKAFLQEQWSEEAFFVGLRSGQDDYVNFMRILRRGESPICLRDLPAPLMMAIAYLPLYRECAEASGQLLPQRLRGQLVEVAARLTNGAVNRGSQSYELLAVLENHLPVFLHSSGTSVAAYGNGD